MGNGNPSARRLALSVLLATVALALVAVAVANPAAQIPDKFTNLQVLPKDIGQRPLIDQMKGFAIGLGVRCWYCHDGQGDDLSTFNFAADSKLTKETARKHLRMMLEINEKFFANAQNKVTCQTCHRGAAQPKAPEAPRPPA